MPDYTIVQCSEGHYFSTIWLPLVSFKAIRLGDRRLQRSARCAAVSALSSGFPRIS
ncbi:hypothetical protein [Amycolatopsis sp. Poz14]|uniref:hypothetical protein n=1 Tax=Amycolatopsis sp. Poz14 TaxID=1447705 RepID=UPI001EE89EDA|nr:hypothetical protein [Amycolatopsis sp. Poz14]MCG3756406.1 hypothetical protein [Amycolatopsis sp. Poz14]